jgi:tripartite-type tricarboxylate transporter receptor subunit TctC
VDRSPTLPDVATAHEQGLTDFEAAAWNGIFLPKETPTAIVEKLHGAIIATLETPAVAERLKQLGATVVAPERRSSAYLQKFVVGEIDKWAAIIKAANIKPQ